MHLKWFESLQKLCHIVSNFVKKTEVLQSIQCICNLNGTCLHNRIIKYFHTILYHFSVRPLLEIPFSRSLKAWDFLPKLFTLSFHLNEDMLLERCWKKRKDKLPNKVLSMQLLKFKCLKWTIWFIRKPHSNVRDCGWETAQKWLKGPRKLFDIVKVRDSRVRDTERIYKGSYWECWRDQIKNSTEWKFETGVFEIADVDCIGNNEFLQTEFIIKNSP